MAEFFLYLLGFVVFLAIDVMLYVCMHFSENAGISALFVLILIIYNGVALLTVTLYFVQPQWLKRLRKFI